MSKVKVTNDLTLTRGKKIVNNSQIIIALLPAFLLIALRSENIGTDLVRYQQGFLNLQYTEFSLAWLFEQLSIREPVFILINYFTGLVSNWNFQAFIIVTALIQFTFVFKSLKKLQSKGYKLTIPFAFFLIFIFIRSFSMVRQSIAMAIVLYAYTFLEEKNYKKFWIYSIIAIGVHYTALISVLIYFWTKVDKVSVFKRLGMVIAFLLVLIYGEIILSSVFSMIGAKYANFSFNADFSFGNFLIRLPLLIIIIMYSKAMKEEYLGIDIYLFIFYLDIIVAQFKYLNVQFERLTMYTFMSLFFILPVLYKVLRQKFGRRINIVFVTAFIAWFIYNLYFFTNLNPYNLMPYEFFWQQFN